MPEQNKKVKSDKTKSLSWDEIISKFIVHGISAEQVRKMTLKQIHYALRELNEDLKIRIRLAGGEVEDDSNDRELTLQDLMGLGM